MTSRNMGIVIILLLFFITTAIAIPDTTAPVITVIGSDSVNVYLGSGYTDAGATALDDVDGDLTSSISIFDPVNTDTLGTYTVTYDVSDTAGNPAIQKTRTVNVIAIPDTTPPVITVLGLDPVNVYKGSLYTDAGATALDDVDGDLTSSISIFDPVNTDTLGTYTVTYDVSDAAGNPAIQKTRTVNVKAIPDKTPPVITVLGLDPVNVYKGSLYTDAGATALDDVDGDLTSSISIFDPVNTDTLGTYTVTYDVSDAAGNPAIQKTRTVNVKAIPDKTPPVITVLGLDPVNVYKGSLYTDAGATALDDVDGDLTSSITTVNPVKTHTLGTYTVTYDVSDAAGNPAIQKTRTVNVIAIPDTTAPVITVLGLDPKNVYLGSGYTDAGATALDDVDGDLTSSISTFNPVKTHTLGIYTVTYDVSDAAGNPAIQKTRTVNVKAIPDTTPPLITVLGLDPVNVYKGSVYTDAGATALDDVDGDLTSSISTFNPVKTHTLGTYTVTYDVSDAAGNPAIQKTRTVNVKAIPDTTPPLITVLGLDPVNVYKGSVYTDAGATALDDVDGDLTSSITTVNPVKTHTLGTYTVTYDVSDAAGNPAIQKTRTVNVKAIPDTTPPLITVLGLDPVNVYKGSVYTDAGATALDDVDGDLTSSITTVNPVKTHTLGTYTVTYYVSDTAGNPAIQKTRTVNVKAIPDTTPPLITVLGLDPVNVYKGSVYTDAGATALDDVDGDLTSSITTVNPVKTHTLGTYTVTYDVSDAAGNPAIQKTRTVNVKAIPDTTPPLITVLGLDPKNVYLGSGYIDAGATASDNIDGDITDNIVNTSNVNTAIKGTYTVTYNVSDAAGNYANEKTRTVNVIAIPDTTKPVITVLGDNPAIVHVGSSYTDAGATASDNIDGDITDNIVKTSNVNTAIKGTYTVTYNVSDAAGNYANEKTRTVNVVDTTPPNITLKGNNPETVQAGTDYTEAGATVTDNYDTGLTATRTGSVNTLLVGSYNLTYNAVDSSSNAATPVTRTVNVIDTKPPIWSLTPSSQIVQVKLSFSYFVRAKDASIITYIINDTINFSIDSSGHITNVTELNVGVCGLNITANDTFGNSISKNITVTVQTEPTYSVDGYVFDNNNASLEDVIVQSSTYSGISYDTGYYKASGLLNGTYNFSYSKDGFNTDYLMIVVSGSNVRNANMTVFDTTPPGQVTGLVSLITTQTTINLGWSPTASASYYRIYRNSNLTGTTQNTYWNETGLEPGTLYQYWVKANDSYNNWGENASVFNVTTALPITPKPTPPPYYSVGGVREGSSGGSGGGGGGTSGENYDNIELIEKYDLQISKDVLTSYRFTHEKNPIMFINITGNNSIGIITTSTEVLKNTSTLVNIAPEWLVYKNINIWVGTSGIGTPRNIKQALIEFRVDNSWMSNNNIKSSNIKMGRWDGSKWDQLETSVIKEDGKFTYYESKTNAFSSFAITGLEIKKSIPENAITIESTKSVVKTLTEEIKSDFMIKWILIIGVFFAIGLIIEMYLWVKKKRT